MTLPHSSELRELLDRRTDDTAALLQDMIRIRSYSGEEREVVEYILAEMRKAGFDECFHDKMGNAVGRFGNGPIKILYDAHIDTVHVTDEELWTHPPLGGVIENGIIYGRGAVDEKAAMAGYLAAVRAMRQCCGDKLPFTLYVIGSVMEEDCDGAPLLHFIEKENIRPDFVVLGEPTNLKVYRGQRGRMEIQVGTRGVSAHGAHNERGVNAINLMMPIVRSVETLDKSLPHRETLGKGSITVSQITSRGPSLCSVPDGCQIHIDRRLTIGETQESALAELRAIATENNIDADVRLAQYKGTAWTGLAVEQEAYFPTWLTDLEHPLIRAALMAATESLGKPAETGVWSFSTNGVATAGRLGIPTIGFAPGMEELAHSRYEEIRMDDLTKAAQFYALFPFALSQQTNHTTR